MATITAMTLTMQQELGLGIQHLQLWTIQVETQPLRLQRLQRRLRVDVHVPIGPQLFVARAGVCCGLDSSLLQVFVRL
jgi:hypothetical protein